MENSLSQVTTNVDLNSLVAQAAQAQAQEQLHSILFTVGIVVLVVIILLYIA